MSYIYNALYGRISWLYEVLVIMKQRKTLLLSLFLAPLLSYAEPDVSLKDCQSWQDEIQYYTDLKREGGSERDIERWVSKRRKYQERYNHYECEHKLKTTQTHT